MNKQLFRKKIVIGIVLLSILAVFGQSATGIAEGYNTKDETNFCEIYKSENTITFSSVLNKLESASASIIYVDDDYNSSTPGWNYTHFNKIRDGIDAASEGNTVFVYSGYYEEYVILNKSIQLIGENRDSTFIFGEDKEPNNQREIYVVKITANNSEFSGFSIVGEGFGSDGTNCDIYIAGMRNVISRNSVSDCIYGIFANRRDLDSGIKVRNNLIHDNKICNCKCSGIYLERSSDNTISSNIIERIDCMSEFGAIQVLDSNANYIVDNIIEDSKIGINMEGGKTGYTVINRNQIKCFQANIVLKYAGDRNFITSNNFLYAEDKKSKHFYIEGTDNVKLLGNYYQGNPFLRVYIVFVHVEPFGIPLPKLIPVVDLNARLKPNDL